MFGCLCIKDWPAEHALSTHPDSLCELRPGGTGAYPKLGLMSMIKILVDAYRLIDSFGVSSWESEERKRARERKREKVQWTINKYLCKPLASRCNSQ